MFRYVKHSLQTRSRIKPKDVKKNLTTRSTTCIGIDVRPGGGGAAASPNFGQLSFLGQQEKKWAKAVVKDVSMVIELF